MKTKGGKVDHVAFVSRDAMFWPKLPDHKPGLRSFVRIPVGYTHGVFTVTWLEPDAEWAVIRFQVWKRRKVN